MNKPLLTFTLLLLTFGLTFTSFAQESGFPTEETERPAESQYPAEENYTIREGGMLMPEERSTVSPEKKSDTPAISTQTKQPAMRMKPAAGNQSEIKKPEPGPVDEETDESVLSFNFLYYLIQKFKFDSVE